MLQEVLAERLVGLRLLRVGQWLVGAAVRPAVGPAVPVGEDGRAAQPDGVVHDGGEAGVAGPGEDAPAQVDVRLLALLARAPAPVRDVVGEAAVAPEPRVAGLAVREEAAA